MKQAISCLPFKPYMEATYISETSIDFQHTKLHYIRGERTLHDHRCENLKFDIETFQVLLLLLIIVRFSPGKRLAVPLNGRKNSHIQRIYYRCVFRVNVKVKLNSVLAQRARWVVIVVSGLALKE
jgi:hypothetical protein